MRGILAFLLLSAAALAQTPAKSALDKAALEAYLRHLLLYPKNVTVEIADPKPSDAPGFHEVRVRASAGAANEERIFYVSNDGKKLFQATVYDLAKNPFEREMKLLKTELQPSLGTPGAPVVIAVFSDFQCQFCRDEAKTLREKLIQAYPEQVRLYFKDMPLAQIHPWALPAAQAGRCIFRDKPRAFWDYHDWAFDKQAELNEQNFRQKLNEYAAAKGLDAVKLNQCIDSKATLPEIEQSMAEARALGVNSTPTLFINGRKISSAIRWENLKQIIDFELDYQTAANNAGEQCCTVKLPSPLDPQ
jgi:protein-disulfide isomerase